MALLLSSDVKLSNDAIENFLITSIGFFSKEDFIFPAFMLSLILILDPIKSILFFS